MSLLINHYNKWVYCHIPKTGGTSISSVLNTIPKTQTVAGHDSFRNLDDIHNYFKFTIVRNPFTRIASAYFHEMRRKKNYLSFEHFLKKSNENDLWFLNQTYYTHEGMGFDKKMDYIGKYETYNESVRYIFQKLGINNDIPHINRNPIYDKHPLLNQEQYYKHLYTEEWMKDWVRERYKNDFKIFNYGMEI